MTTEKVELESELDYTDDEDIDEGCEAEASAPAFTVTGFWGERLDKVMAAMLPDVSRARLQKLIETGKVEVNGAVVDKVRFKVAEGDAVRLLEPPKLDEALHFEPEEGVEFETIYEDEAIIVVESRPDLSCTPGRVITRVRF